MKNHIKYLAWLGIASLTVLTACEDEGTDYVTVRTADGSLKVESLSPAYGYPGDEFDVIGKDFAYASDFIKVYIGDDLCKVLSCTDQRITVRIPMDATSGLVSVKLLDNECKSDLMLRVLGEPSVESVSKTWGFVGEAIRFEGSLLGNSAEDILLYFADARNTATITDWSEDGFTATIPSDATTGPLSLNVYTKKVNTPIEEFEIRKHATVSNITPEAVYAGESFTIEGFNYGLRQDECAVYVGNEKMELLSWDETSIKVRIPGSARLARGEELEVKITTAYETVVAEKSVTVLNDPSVSGIDPASGYIGSKVTLTGTDFPASSERVSLRLGGKAVAIDSYDMTDGTGTISFTVPTGLPVGDNRLEVLMGDYTAYSGNFKVLATPTLLKAEFTVVKPGETVRIEGASLGASTSGVSATIGGVNAEIKYISDDLIEIAVPASMPTTGNAKVELSYASLPSVSDVYLDIIGAEGDVTMAVLHNANAPFTTDGQELAGNWGIPTGWDFNSAMYAGDELIRPLLIESGYPDGAIAFWCNKFADELHRNPIRNGKMSQSKSLPAGTYEFTVDMGECKITSGELGAIFGVAKGNSLTDIEGSGHSFKPTDESAYLPAESGRAFAVLTDKTFTRSQAKKTPVKYTFTFTLTERTYVTMGLTVRAAIENGVGGTLEIKGITVNYKNK